MPKLRARERLIASTAAPSARTVKWVHPKPTPAARTQRISVTLSPHEQTALHARANGYVRRWSADLGEQVEAGELLAEIDTPELDRELDQANSRLAESDAALTLATAEREFAHATLQRYRELAANKLTSKRELDRCQADANIADARVQVAQAARLSLRSSVERLAQLGSSPRRSASPATRPRSTRTDSRSTTAVACATP